MLCPRCKNPGGTGEGQDPILVYGKDKYDTVDKRYKVCTKCGYRFVTAEKLDHAVESVANNAPDLFEEAAGHPSTPTLSRRGSPFEKGRGTSEKKPQGEP